jgi:hypothetical protein
MKKEGERETAVRQEDKFGIFKRLAPLVTTFPKRGSHGFSLPLSNAFTSH